jgi:uncharacterized membrane protein YvbJ
MYCSSCGSSVAKGLSFCKRCGAKLSGAKSEGDQSTTYAESLIWAIVAVFIVGLGGTIGLMALMKNELGFGQGLILTFTALSFLLIFIIEGVLISLLLRSKNRAREESETARLEEKPPKELNTARALAEPAPSVTEHTTRTFEPIYSERETE